MLDTAESIFDALYSLRSIEEGYGCLIAKGSNRGIYPTESFIAGSKDFNGSSNDSHQRPNGLRLRR